MVLLDKCRIIYLLNEFHKPTLFYLRCTGLIRNWHFDAGWPWVCRKMGNSRTVRT